MTSDDPQIVSLAAQMRHPPLDPQSLQLVRIIAESIDSASLLINGLYEMELEAVVEGIALQNVMTALESLAEDDSLTACKLMLPLWKLSNMHRSHDVCDSIDLWVTGNNTQELREYFRKFIAKQSSLNVRKHFEGMLDVLEKGR